MRIDISAGLTSFDGKPILENTDSENAITLRQTLIMACLNANPQKYNDGEKKYKVFSLLKKVSDASGYLEVTAEEITMLKALVGDLYPVAVVGAVYDMLERNSDDPYVAQKE